MWSTIVDAPVTAAMQLDDFRAYYQDRYGRSAMDGLDDRLTRARDYGSSSGESLSDLVLCNRAGPDESALSLAQIIELVETGK